MPRWTRRHGVVVAAITGFALAWVFVAFSPDASVRIPGGPPIVVATRTARAIVPLDAAGLSQSAMDGAVLRPVVERIGRAAELCVLGGSLTFETAVGPRTITFVDRACRPTAASLKAAPFLRSRDQPVARTM